MADKFRFVLLIDKDFSNIVDGAQRRRALQLRGINPRLRSDANACLSSVVRHLACISRPLQHKELPDRELCPAF